MGKASEDMSSSTAQARKRRMERRAKKDGDEGASNKKLRLDDEVVSDSESSTASEPKPATTLSKDALAKIPGVKKQARYVPAVPMTKEELTMWRKEARRVRNRESAAASRQKTQKRITELEDEVGTLTKKYEAALRRIVELEAAAAAGNSSSAWRPKTVALHHQDEEATPASPELRATHTVSPPLSPRDSFSLNEEDASIPDLKTALYPHYASAPTTATTTFTKISRHNAVKIHGSGSIGGASSVADAYAADPSQELALPQWNESATDHAAALTMAIPSAEEDAVNDYPIATEDFELGDFLMDAMDHAGAPTPVVSPAPMDELAACDALHMFGDLPQLKMNLPPP